MPRRRRTPNRQDGPPSREEFDALAAQVRKVMQKAQMGLGISPVLSGEPGEDDSFEYEFDGNSETATDSGTVGGYLPGEIPYITDGIAPTSSPTPEVEGGIGFLAVKWAAVSNADPVTYEVHLSTTTGFTPDGTTLAGETPGLLAFIERMPDGTAFTQGTTYYCKIIAKDEDGSAAAGSQDSTTLRKLPTNHLQTDGGTPAKPAVDLVSGPGWIQAKWATVAGTIDPVTYYVYCSASSGFTPDAGNFIGQTAGNTVVINKLTAGTQLATGTTYYVKVIAASDLSGNVSATSDEDSATPAVIDASVTTFSNINAGTITTGTLDAARIAAGSLDANKITANTITANEIAADAITTSELAADAVVAENILAEAVTAAKIESVMNLSSSFLAGSFPGANVQVGFGVKDDGAGNPVIDPAFIGVRAYDGTNDDPVFKLPADGSPASFRGVVKFGSHGLSKLLVNDMVQLEEQTTGAFAMPLLVQSIGTSSADWTSPAHEFESDPTVGNVVICVMTHWDGGGAGTLTTPSGFTSLHQKVWGGSSNGRTAVFGKVATGTGDGGPGDPVTVTISKNADIAIIQLFEFSGATITEHVGSDEDEDNSGGNMTMTTPATSAISQRCLVLGVGMAFGSYTPGVGGDSAELDSYPASYTFAGNGMEWNPNYFSPGNSVEQGVFYKVADSGTQSFSIGTNADADAGLALCLVLEAAANGVEPAEANTVRMYAQDVSGNTYLHTTDEDGRECAVVLGTAGEVWRLEHLVVTKDVANVPAHGTLTETWTGISGLAVGDLVYFLNKDSPHRLLVIRAKAVCAVAGELQMQFGNADTADVNPPSDDYHFLIWHKS